MISPLFAIITAFSVANAADGEKERAVEEITPYVNESKLKRTDASEEEAPKVLKRVKAGHGVLHLDLKKLKDSPSVDPEAPIVKRENKEK
jgi:hypothetical protein